MYIRHKYTLDQSPFVGVCACVVVRVAIRSCAIDVDCQGSARILVCLIARIELRISKLSFAQTATHGKREAFNISAGLMYITFANYAECVSRCACYVASACKQTLGAASMV